MSSGIDQTFEILSGTGNEAASAVLLAGLDSPHRAIQEASLRALLSRRSYAGQRALVARWHRLDDRWKSIVAETPGRITRAVRDAVLSGDSALCAKGCAATLFLREYDLIPALVNATEDEGNPNRETAGKTLRGLAQALYDELAGPRDYSRRRDPQLTRQHVVSVLEKSVRRFDSHKRIEIIEAFLMLVRRDNSTLKKILQDPHDKCYLSLVDTLTHSPHLGVMRLALNFVDDPHAPSSTLSIISHRTDAAFLRHLFKKIGFEPSAHAKTNLKRIDSIPWLRGDLSLLDDFDGPQQHAAVQLVMATSTSRLGKFEVVKYILQGGQPAGRLAAAKALAEFKGAEAKQLVQDAADDHDPNVKATALEQLRDRGIPNAMSRLIEALDSPHSVVCKAARKNLKELNFTRYLSNFDMLDDDVRRHTGLLVKKIDPDTIELLRKELSSAARSRRLRGLEAAPVIDAVADVESQIIGLLSDSDHFVRAQAARALASSQTSESQQALRQALLDKSVMVHEAAEQTLQELARPVSPSTDDHSARVGGVNSIASLQSKLTAAVGELFSASNNSTLDDDHP